jgi:hypothetical protein
MLSYRITSIILVFSLYFLSFSSNSVVAWKESFEAPIKRLSSGQWQDYPMSQKSFNKISDKLWTFLKKKKNDWAPLINPDLKQEELMVIRNNLKQYSYIDKIFSTKAGTFIFETTEFPDIIVKIDNRPASSFDKMFRSYLSAYEKTQKVINELPGRFDFLYLPLENGRDSKEAGVKVVFSQKIPLFSVAEIDNMVLLILLLQQSQDDQALRAQVKQMFSQLITYICHVDFNDINYRNLPFALDGRLAPFDTDTFQARTGVNSFMEAFFAHRVLSENEVLELISKNCPSSYAQNPANIKSLYKNIAGRDEAFNANSSAMQQYADFIAKESVAKENYISSLVSDKQKDDATMLEEVILKKLRAPSKQQTIFAQRCEHIKDLINQAVMAREANNKPAVNFEAASMELKAILQIAADNNIISTYLPITIASGYDDLRGFICL